MLINTLFYFTLFIQGFNYFRQSFVQFTIINQKYDIDFIFILYLLPLSSR